MIDSSPTLSTKPLPSKQRRSAIVPGYSRAYSKNPIIDRFLQLTIDEGKHIRGVSLCYCTSSLRQVIFSLDDGSNEKLVSDLDPCSFNASWKEACEFLKRLRGIHMSPAA
jgi:hypothetical protein